MACEDGVFNTVPILRNNTRPQLWAKIMLRNNPQDGKGKYVVRFYNHLQTQHQTKWEEKYLGNSIEDAMDWALNRTQYVVDETGDYCATQIPPEPVEAPPSEEPQTTFFQGIADAFRNMVGGDATPPQERTMSDNEKAQIEEHIRNMDIDFKEEMRNNGVTLTKDGNNAWDKIRNAVRDGTLPLSNYNNDYLRGKLEQEGYFTQAEPTDQDPLRFGDQIQDMGKVRQDDFGGKEKPPAQPPMGGPIEYDREGRPKDMPMEEPRGNLFGGFLEMLFPPQLPEQEEEMRMKEIEREEADLSPEDPEEIARKDREKDVVKTDSGFEQAHGQITQEGERAWEEVRMKYLDFGGFNYQKEVQAVIEKHRIPDPVDCVVDVAPWQDWENDCDNSGMMVRVRQRPVTATPPRFGGEPCPPYSELPPSVEEKPCPTPVEEELPPVATIPEEEVGPSQPTKSIWEELTGWIDFGDGTITDTMPTPVQVDSGTNQDSLLPDQTTPIAPAESTPTPPPTTEIPAPVDCRQELSEWEEWSDCRYGKRSRGRSLTTYPAENGGEPCGPRPILTEKEDCEEEPIGSLCGFGGWDSWSEWDCKDSPWSQGGDWYMTRTRKRYTTYLLTKEDDYRVSPSLAKCRKEHPLEDTMENGIGIADHIEWLNGDESSGVMVQVQTERQKCPPCQEGYIRSDKEVNYGQCEPLPVEETVVVDNGTTQDSLLPAQTSTPASTTETPAPTEVTVNIVQPASSGEGGGQTTTTTTETTEDEETTTEEPEESNALKIVGGLAVLSGIGYWAYKKYA